ncbi:uncharacterized protein LOC110718790 isoform X2 [Chenopodium quinoa]|uniref:uncharacterized protein LOC110718790 isoform X2 n=1 Tax=Chenopodium quinoa TaxID=63459 RepID=UPI000B786E43|nr:uncharacterized protein LOC110718790 isoform X2 [Chenopodium quinoa]
MDEDLRDAALSGDVEFLRKCVESNKPMEYYLSYYPKSSDADKHDRHHGNIFHMAAYNNREEFLREAIKILPLENTHQLLLQPREPLNGNPLHVAADLGNVKIIKMMLDVYRSMPSLPSDLSQRPWLQQTTEGDTPCYLALANDHEECALATLQMDMELICNTPDNRGVYMIYDAVYNKLSRLALEILRSPYSICCTGYEGRTPFHLIHVLNSSEEAEEIFRRLLQREPGLIEQVDENGFSVFYHWVFDGKMWPFKCLLKCHDIIPDVKSVFVDMVSSTNIYGDNLLHNLAEYTSREEIAIEIAKLLIDIYKQESSNIDVLPWLVQDTNEDTPLSLAIARQYEKFAMYIISVDEDVIITSQQNVLFLAIEKGCHEVAKKIFDIIENKGWTQLLYSDQKNVLHLAPLCKQEFCTRLVEGHPELLNGIDKGGITILHSWLKKGEEWLFKYILESKWRSTFVKLIKETDYNKWNNPFHVAATTTNNEATNQVVKLLVEAFKEEFPNWNGYSATQMPWFIQNKAKEGPLHVAIRNKNEKLALYILSLYEEDHINELLDYYEPEHITLFLAIQNDCQDVTKNIMSRLDKGSWTKYLKDISNGRNILHLAPSLTNEKFGTWLVNAAPEFITQKDNNKQSSWDKAYEIGPAWFIKAVLEKDPSVFNSAPLVWTKACEKGHVNALYAFIEHNPGAFRDLCIGHKDSPLHHIRLPNLTEYEKFIKISHMKDLINIQNDQDETPLHKAIRKGDIFLTETLLNMDKIIYDITDKTNVTAMDLLAHVYKEDNAWGHMCKRNGLDPTIKTTYFQHKTNLLDVRTSLFLVAALLATITFTAGFTLPGGFNQDTGEALLGKKASFLVFLVSDTLALFFSMLVLICLTWSMVFKPSKSLILIDRSMVLLRIALNCTLLAFMTGVYIVMAPRSLWVAILIIVIISFLIIISVDKTFLYEVMDKLFLIANKSSKDPMQLAELGYYKDGYKELIPLLPKNELNDANEGD